MEKLLEQLVGRTTKTFGDRLVSVILYGSAAVGDHTGRYSDINVLCVLDRITTRELADAEPVFRWWRELGNPSPLLLTEEEVRTSTDCFPIEFRDIRERHRVLYGRDVVADLEIDDCFYRAQVEHELRAKLLRLRQKGAGVMRDRELLVRLLAESVSTFCVLTRHALILHGVAASLKKREIVEQARQSFGLDPAPFLLLLDLREAKIKPKAVDAVALYEQYLSQLQRVVAAVDRLAK
jgi:predicted nucleotidyltransferase